MVNRLHNRDKNFRERLRNSKRRIERRLDKSKLGDCERPALRASNIHYEVSAKTRALGVGGIGTMHLLAQRLGLVKGIDDRLHLLKVHLPYHESDHVLNIAYNALCDGKCFEDIELRRNDETFLDALGARRIPDPTTAGDFCRRFTPEAIQVLQEVIDDARIEAWRPQPATFFEHAYIDADGSMVGTTGECKRDMDRGYDGTWGYQPLLVSLANTREVLRLVNRPASRPSHEGAAEQLDQAMAVCFRGGFRQVTLRGDTDFSQTQHLDRWHADQRVRFIFGYDAYANLENKADALEESAWRKLDRPPRYTVATKPRTRPENVKEQVVIQREYENKQLVEEHVAEFRYKPTACKQEYRMVVVRKTIKVTKGQLLLFEDLPIYFFYITNDFETPAQEIVFLANDRCDQENLIQQLKNGSRALKAPLDTLESNWAYMVMVALSWTMKAWWALALPETGRWAEQYREDKERVLRMDFKTFVNAFVRIPCQILRSGRRLIYRVLAWNPLQPIFFRLVQALRC